MTETKPLVFISCGEATSEEREVGEAIEKLIGEHPTVRVYRARREGTLNSRATEIVQNLHDASAYVVILPQRDKIGEVNGKQLHRTSVWIEQELAIAHYCNAHKSARKQIVFEHHTIKTEGLRGDLKLNAVPYETSGQILEHLRKVLPSWLPTSSLAGETQLRPAAYAQVRASGGGKYEEWRLVPCIQNQGAQSVSDWSLDAFVPNRFNPVPGHWTRLSPETIDGEEMTHLRISQLPSVFNVPTASNALIPGDTSPLSGIDVSIPNPPNAQWQAAKSSMLVLRVKWAPKWEPIEYKCSFSDLHARKQH